MLFVIVVYRHVNDEPKKKRKKKGSVTRRIYINLFLGMGITPPQPRTNDAAEDSPLAIG